MDLDELLHVLWDARDYVEEYGFGEEIDDTLISRIESQMDIIEEEIWKGKG